VPEPVQTVGYTVAERLERLTPEVSWDIDFPGKMTFLGLSTDEESLGSLDWILQEGAGSVGASDEIYYPGGFVARYFWEMDSDLNAELYRVYFLYIDADRYVLYKRWQPLLEWPNMVPGNRDGGIGTVLVTGHYVPLPLERVHEVRILVKQKMEGNRAHLPLLPVTGRRWMRIGLPPLPEPPAEHPVLSEREE
jgi:hypothetical protein